MDLKILHSFRPYRILAGLEPASSYLDWNSLMAVQALNMIEMDDLCTGVVCMLNSIEIPACILLDYGHHWQYPHLVCFKDSHLRDLIMDIKPDGSLVVYREGKFQFRSSCRTPQARRDLLQKVCLCSMARLSDVPFPLPLFSAKPKHDTTKSISLRRLAAQNVMKQRRAAQAALSKAMVHMDNGCCRASGPSDDEQSLVIRSVAPATNFTS